jgi:hypothetical protein
VQKVPIRREYGKPISYGNGIGEYNADGTPVNTSFITGLVWPSGLAVSGNDLFVANEIGGVIGEYTTSGATVNASLITGPNALSIAVTPEPGTLALLVLGGLIALCRARPLRLKPQPAGAKRSETNPWIFDRRRS